MQDCEILAQILSEDCIILLDDFEELRKAYRMHYYFAASLRAHSFTARIQ